MDRVIFALLCSIIFFLPFPLGTYRIWAYMLVGVLICSAFLVHTAICIKSDTRFFPKRNFITLFVPLLLVCFALTFQLLPTSFQSIDPYQTQIMLFKTFIMILFVWLLAIYLDSTKKIRTFVYWLLCAAVLQSFYGIYLSLLPDVKSFVFEFKPSDRAMGSFTYQNFLANYLGMCLAVGLGLFVSDLQINKTNPSFRAKIRATIESLVSKKMIIRLALVLIVLGLILTRSRMGNTAFFTSLALVSLYAFFFYKNRPNNLRLFIVSFFVIDLIIVGSIFGIEKVKERIVETNFTSETRDEVVRDSIPLVLDNFLIGTGGGTFYTAFPKYQPAPYTGYYDNAHNDYIQFAAELGVPVTIVLGLMLFYFLTISFRLMAKASNPLHQGLAFATAVSIIFMMFHSFVDYSLQAGANSLTFMAILTLLAIVYEREFSVKRS